ncbi:MAG TPA: CBS domain-containing protein [Gammaproteobacteria bacterium]|nr:CBS domain-containing protein [Gammaproteobacteria bacterium]
MTGHEQLVAAFLDLHATNAARLLEALPVEQTNAVLACVDAATAAPVFAQMLPTYAAQCLEREAPAGGALLLERLGTQDAAAILRHLGRDTRAAVLDSLGPQWVMSFKLLLSYPTNTVGAWVEPRVLTLPDDCNAGEARERIASSTQPAQVRIYVLDRSRRIRGAIRGLSLLQVPNRRPLTAILEPADALWAREALATAQEHRVWERNTEAPVINRDEEFIGVISYTDLRRAFRDSTRSGEGNGRRDLAEVTELIAIGAGSLWQSLGDLIRPEREK